MYDWKFSFSDYSSIRKYSDPSFTTKYDKLDSFYYPLNEFRNLVPLTEKTKIDKYNVAMNHRY